MLKYIATFIIYFVFIWFSPILGAGLMDDLGMVIKAFQTLTSKDYIFDWSNYQLLISTASSVLLTYTTFKEITA
jgi:hypothetical protein